jgi:transposase
LSGRIDLDFSLGGDSLRIDMTRYSKEFKEQIVRKMMPPNSQSVSRISKDSGIAAPTLYAWRNQYRSEGHVVPAKTKDPEGWGWKDKSYNRIWCLRF